MYKALEAAVRLCEQANRCVVGYHEGALNLGAIEALATEVVRARAAIAAYEAETGWRADAEALLKELETFHANNAGDRAIRLLRRIVGEDIAKPAPVVTGWMSGEDFIGNYYADDDAPASPPEQEPRTHPQDTGR